MKQDRKENVNQILTADEDGFYVLKHKRSFATYSYTLQKYSNDLGLLWEKEFNPPEHRGDNVKLQEVIPVQGGFAMLTRDWNRKTHTNTAFLTYIDDQGNTDNKLVQVDQIQDSKLLNQGNFAFTLSEDSSKLLIFHNEPHERKGHEKMAFRVFDNKLNLMWENPEVVLPYSDELFEVSGTYVDADAMVYVTGKVFKEKVKNKRRGEVNYRYVILQFGPEDEEPEEYSIEVPDRLITDLTMTVMDHQIIATGLFGEKRVYTVQGTFYQRINKETKAVEVSSSKEFGADYLSQFMSDRKAKKGKELHEFDLSDLVVRADGGAVLVAEQYYITTHTNYNPNTGVTTTTTIYHYNDLLVTSINPDGTIAWVKKVPKRQVTREDGGYWSSYALAVTDDKIHFFFNDNPKNLERTPEDKPKNMNSRKKAMVVAVTLDMEGNYSKQSLFQNKDLKTITRPKVCKQVRGDEIILLGEKGKKYRFAKVTLASKMAGR